MQVTIILIVNGAFGTVTKGLLKGLEDLEVGGRVEINSIIENGHNTAKSPGDLKRLVVTQTPMKDHQLISTLGTVTKGLVQGMEDLEIRGSVETIQTKSLL